MENGAQDGDVGLAEASASFMRAMLTVGGRLLDDMAAEARPSATLRYLCDAARELLDADRVVVKVHDTTVGLGDGFASPPSGRDDLSGLVKVDIGVDGAVALGEIEVCWGDPGYEPTALDREVASRFAVMAQLILGRHLAKRRQLQAIAREREAFAGEIHDDPVQVMTAVSLQLQRVESRLPEGELREAVRQAKTLNNEAMERLRHVMFSLHPTTLAEDGLAATIEAYCESFVEPSGIGWEVVGDDCGDLPDEVAALAFRLCRNALVNTVEHSRAARLVVDLRLVDGVLRVGISDDGTGFDMAEMRHPRVGHLGIPHAVALAEWAAGTYTTVSAPGQGTVVSVELPVS